MKHRLLAASLCCAAALSAEALAASTSQGTRIGFDVHTQRQAPNDLGTASATLELAGASAAELAAKLNATVAEAMELARAQPKVVVRSGGTRTWPIYAGGKPKSGAGAAIESWRMRAELLLESRDANALAHLLGQLHPLMTVSDIAFAPAPETRRRVEDEATLEAIRVVRERAARYAGAFKRGYKVRSLNIHAGPASPAPTFRSAPAIEGTLAAPIEAGESTIQIRIDSQIELLETPAAK